MKKFKELIIHCDSHTQALEELVAVGNFCQTPPFSYSEEVEKLYEANDKLDHILVTLPELPQAILLLYVSDNKLKVINIVPFNHSCDQIEKDVYNQIVDAFHQTVVVPLFKDKHKITLSRDDIPMKDIIPNSYEALYSWVKSPGAPQSPFSHQLDLERWFNFLCVLHQNGEELTSGDLEQWLLEEMHWSEEIVDETISRYENELDLLTYYDCHFSRVD